MEPSFTAEHLPGALGLIQVSKQVPAAENDPAVVEKAYLAPGDRTADRPGPRAGGIISLVTAVLSESS
jgi:hypothetical protein